MKNCSMKKVSIITPCYNSAAYIGDCIESVLHQTYSNWEMYVIDDCSTDGSASIINEYVLKDNRISYIRTQEKTGSPTLPRNLGIKVSQGDYIAFLDSDDLWLPDKLKQQLLLFDDEKVAIVYSNYEKITNMGVRSHRVVVAPQCVSYERLLRNNVIGCLTAIYDLRKVGKIYFQNIGHEDFVMWLTILKKGFVAHNTNTVTALYREQRKSLSSNKIKASLWTWNIYRHVERMSIISSCYYFVQYVYISGMKYLK